MTVLLYSEIWKNKKNKFVLYTISDMLSKLAVCNNMSFTDFYEDVKREILNTIPASGHYTYLSTQDVQVDILNNKAPGHHAETVAPGIAIYVADGARTDRKIHIVGVSIDDEDSSFMNLSGGRRIRPLLNELNEFPGTNLEVPDDTEENKEEFKLTILGDK